ncbi:MAG: hypothetical protein QOG89_2860, partial [Thermomicrobiales bacterium]|nr:hypothetical protein [Thermomicrobiales bacterium]
EDARYELIRGELRPMSPVGDPHGTLLFRVGSPLDRHIDENLLGRLSGGDVGIILESDPDTVLAPDIAFFREQPRSFTDIEEGFVRQRPTLVVEIASPSDSKQDLRQKGMQFLDAGVPHVWLVESRTRSVSWIGQDRIDRVFHVGDILDGGDLIPGFRLAVADIFR